MEISWEEHDSIKKEQLVKLSDEVFGSDVKLEPVYDIDYMQYDVYDGDLMVGVVLCNIFNGNILYIESIEIDEDYRDRGYGTATIKTLIDYYDIKYISGASLASAIDFWNKFGAEIPIKYKQEDPNYMIPFKVEIK